MSLTFSMRLLLAAGAAALLPAAAQAIGFVPGNLVVSVEGNGVYGATAGAYTDNQAAPLTLFQYSHAGTASATYAGSLVLPTSGAGVISAEYGSSSEGLIQLSGNGAYLSIMGYGVDAAAFNANPTAYGTLTTDPTKPAALGQSGSLSGQSYTAVSRVVALISGDGAVDTSTRLNNVFNGNNPRSVYTADGSSVYVSGQGLSGDTTGGVFYATRGATGATAITGLDTNNKTQAQDTRFVTVVNNQLTVSVDSKSGSGNNRDFIGTLGNIGQLPTGLANGGNGPTKLPGFGNSGGTGKVVLTADQANGINAAGREINLSPEQFFFANATTLYVADSGQPKNDSALNDSNGSALGAGGLQKWSLIGGTWVFDYTLSAGLDLVANTATSGVTGLLGLTGQVNGATVDLYATSYVKGDLDQTYLYGITDLLAATARPTGERFATLAAAPVDSKFQGVSFAPTVAGAVPEPASWAMLIAGFGAVGLTARRRRAAAIAAI